MLKHPTSQQRLRQQQRSSHSLLSYCPPSSSRSWQQTGQQTCATQRKQSDLPPLRPPSIVGQRQPQQLVPGMQPAVLTMDSLLRAAEQTMPQAAGEANKARYRAAYQGVPGAYSEMAACKACPDAEPVPCEQFEVAFQVLRQLAHEVRMLGSA
eukprot:GHRQ01027124.1.p1 GENE.GHRQ01027124.1~~GHRQ01027124.1.p1  ORF type:complete len:153 (+),score=23.13 GHRQ01027124.1:233-691(+)